MKWVLDSKEYKENNVEEQTFEENFKIGKSNFLVIFSLSEVLERYWEKGYIDVGHYSWWHM